MTLFSATIDSLEKARLLFERRKSHDMAPFETRFDALRSCGDALSNALFGVSNGSHIERLTAFKRQPHHAQAL